MSKYRKRPVEVDVIRYTGDNAADVLAFMGGPRQAKVEVKMVAGPGRGMHEALVIHTLEGDMRASAGDWIIRGVQGEYYPCRDDIFQATYEPVPAELTGFIKTVGQ